MAAKNDITGDSIQSKGSSDDYRSNWDRIFGKGDEIVIGEDRDVIIGGADVSIVGSPKYLDELEERILKKKQHNQYSKVKNKGQPNQDTCYYMTTYVTVDDIKCEFEKMRKEINDEK